MIFYYHILEFMKNNMTIKRHNIGQKNKRQ